MIELTNKEIFYKHQAQTSTAPFEIEVDRAEACYFWDVDGKKYLDLIAGIAVGNIGHRHPKVIAAIEKQLNKYLHIMPYGEYVQSPQADLAKALSEILPEQLSCSYFVNSGTEANEAALKLAKRYTNRTELIAFNKSYHGNTHGSLSVSGNEQKKYAFRPLLPNVKFLEFNQLSELEIITAKTAAVIVEPIQGDAGVRIPSVEFMKALRKKCTETGAILIFDEIQTGFGRTGKMFGFEHFNVVPDIITLAKSLGGGMPIGTFISSKEIMSVLTHDPMLGHITTFGGHPVCCAAAKANIDVLTAEPIIKNVEEKGRLFKELLVHDSIIEVRHIGLMIAVELADFDTVKKVVDSLKEKGIIGFWFISCNNSFRLQPPLIITEEQIKYACKEILNSISSIPR